ncbi:hypothetical protein Gaha_0599_001 [Novacetimonas hansenii JCM 7643]|uniref:Uncharacterized protein n=1 Tax=Novacetimonas hansenii ATCC 23769 TaxID=714995 RepID=D5QIE8_NOVHA|nr:hypothetical protein GXY_14647 [Novacetimonas hansenii ATCC 23769]GAN85466.1 hypothetical protein Gaha_0599_001 [Novacetimonas hansenii JCM 7643]
MIPAVSGCDLCGVFPVGQGPGASSVFAIHDMYLALPLWAIQTVERKWPIP